MAQSVERLTLAQVVISRFMSLSPVSGSVLTAQSLVPASESVSSSFSIPPLFVLSLCLSKMNIQKFKKIYLLEKTITYEVKFNSNEKMPIYKKSKRI